MYIVKVENEMQLNLVLESKVVSDIILSRDSFAEKDLAKLVKKIKTSGKLAWILMERISRYEELKDLRTSTDSIYEIKNLDGIIIQNLDSFAYMLRKINTAVNENLMVELNYTMNCYNGETKMVLENLYNSKRKNAKEVPLLFTAPVELNIYELADVGYDTVVLYSYIDTMVSANCLYKNTASQKNVGASYASPNVSVCCKYRFDFEHANSYSSYILDRKNKKLHYKTYCKYCYNKVFNTEPLFLLDKVDEIGARVARPCVRRRELYERNISDREMKYRIDFSFENEKEVKSILSGTCPESFTRGHYKTSIK